MKSSQAHMFKTMDILNCDLIESFQLHLVNGQSILVDRFIAKDASTITFQAPGMATYTVIIRDAVIGFNARIDTGACDAAGVEATLPAVLAHLHREEAARLTV